MLIAYVGFVQSGSIRSFNFEGRSQSGPGFRSKPIELSITADMSVVSRLRMKIQDLPALCHRTLATEVEVLDESGKPPASFVLTEATVQAYCAAKLLAPVRADHRKRFHPKPSENSQLQWPKKA